MFRELNFFLSLIGWTRIDQTRSWPPPINVLDFDKTKRWIFPSCWALAWGVTWYVASSSEKVSAELLSRDFAQNEFRIKKHSVAVESNAKQAQFPNRSMCPSWLEIQSDIFKFRKDKNFVEFLNSPICISQTESAAAVSQNRGACDVRQQPLKFFSFWMSRMIARFEVLWKFFSLLRSKFLWMAVPSK